MRKTIINFWRAAALAVLLLGFSSCEKNPVEPVVRHYSWDTSVPEDQGMNPALLDSAIQQAGQLGFVDGLVIVRNGVLVREGYWNGFDAGTYHNVMSVSKSILSVLIGVAHETDVLTDLDAKMLDYFPEYDTPALDPRKHQITLNHLITMRMGIENEDQNYWTIYNSDNWIRTTIEFPLVYDPGSRMRYNTFQTHLLSAILTKASGMSTLAFALDHLVGPMHISLGSWEKDPQGYYFGGNSMHLTPRDMAAFGRMVINGGQLDGNRIVSQDWIDFSLSPSTANPPNSWGAWENYNYAHLWWLGEINSERLVLAYGWGGQFIFLFPDRNLIVVTTTENLVDSDTSTMQEWALFDIVSDWILPALTD